MLSINSLQAIWDELHQKHDIKFLFTRQLNQDCVENLFSVIRSKGAARDNPDSQQFRAALKQVKSKMKHSLIIILITNLNAE